MVVFTTPKLGEKPKQIVFVQMARVGVFVDGFGIISKGINPASGWRYYWMFEAFGKPTGVLGMKTCRWGQSW